MIFKTEAEFESALIAALQTKGWEKQVLRYPTEEDLLRNWANILFENNRGIDRLNDAPLTDTEMQQIMEQVIAHRTPVKLNGFINGKTISIIRDNPADPIHLGKEVSLKIYDRMEIAAGQSRYQIVQQPKFGTRSNILGDRRGDLMLLINGMPVFHLELKNSGVPVSKACYQIERYANEGVFNGIFSLVQIFVAMEPEETKYFANPGPDGRFNPDFYFNWADFNNEPINHWRDIATYLLSIPMAHQLIGFYTVADDSDGILKVMRSYQYYAANEISDRVSKINWNDQHMLGGYIWHTTGSGKTMTSFKSAQLIANSKDADKVVFLMDRIELGTQSLRAYRAFAEDREEVQATEDTHALIAKLKSKAPNDTLIVTSIQKMSNIKQDDGGLNAADIRSMSEKRIVFIVDEAHRSTFGDMLITIKRTFPDAIFFGFTGTPIHEENQKLKNTTATVFGNELHRYSIADGIRDKNVLGFNPSKVVTYADTDLRRAVALKMANAATVEDATSNPEKKKIFYDYMDSDKVKMAGYRGKDGKYVKGIEDWIHRSQYWLDEHRNAIIKDIADNWVQLSRASKFHALFATSSIAEAIEYYRLMKASLPHLNIAALFDPNLDHRAGIEFKEDGLVEILEDYNRKFDQDFSLTTYNQYRKDIASRLAHKRPYEHIDRKPDQQIDLLIVVDQMLTGFDSKWVNTLYLDKVLRYESVIQAFSRTNRLFGSDKPFGTIRYYRYLNTMERNINDAVALYSGNKPLGLFVEKLDYNLEKMNQIFEDISRLFTLAGISDFSRLPSDVNECGRFAKLFKEFNEHLEAAKIQGFTWDKKIYKFTEPDNKIIEISFDENTYLILALRYKELFDSPPNHGDGGAPFDIDSTLLAIDTGRIDTDYMNSRFEKFLKELLSGDIDPDHLNLTLDELHTSFATLSKEEQKFANIFLHDVQSGNAAIEEGKTFRDYITDYQFSAKREEVRKLATALGLDINKLDNLMNAGVKEANINEYGRFDDLKATVNRDKAKEYFESVEGVTIPSFRLTIKIESLLKDFIINGGFDIDEHQHLES
ncbi:MAG: HsdR family type I site-specific deoxyribonuclease [Eubacteriales bacterium]|nr:HsdR family type I site-specific deoxyribonuclease [Eubacteriales bacterium]